MIPNLQHDPLNLVLKVAVEGKDYMTFVSSGQIRCFLCGEHGHVRQICPGKQNDVADLTGSRTIKKNTVQENNTVIHEVIAEETENNIGENESSSETNNSNVDVDQPADAIKCQRANAQMQNVRTEVQETHLQSKSREDEFPLMECVETNDKSENKLDDEVNENCSQFTVSSGVARSDSDSDNECESIESFFEVRDNDSQTGTSELSRCEVKFYSARQISTFLDEMKGVRNA